MFRVLKIVLESCIRIVAGCGHEGHILIDSLSYESMIATRHKPLLAFDPTEM